MIDVQKIWLTPSAVWIQTTDGRQACEQFADYTLSPFGIHWEHLDEDLCYEGYFAHS